MVSVLVCAVGMGFSGGQVRMIPKVQGQPAPHPYAISADGKTVVGQFAPGIPFTWRGGDTANFRPSSNVNVLDQYAQSVSNNGSVIVGKAGGAYIWTKGKGMKMIGDRSTFAYGVSEDGKSVACQVEGKKARTGFIWRESGLVNLESFSPTCLSGDGKVAAGIRMEHGTVKAFYFHDQVSEALPMPEEFSDSTAFATSRDGGVIVGNVFNARGTFAAAWILGKFSKLDSLGQSEAVARAVTRDGKYIGGYAGSEAVIWGPDGKANYVEMIFRHSGATSAGWKFESVNGIARVGDRIFVTGWGSTGGKDVGYYGSFHVD
jgi:uncharacterized membrane protein